MWKGRPRNDVRIRDIQRATNLKSFSDRTVEQNKEDRECNAREMNALQIAT